MRYVVEYVGGDLQVYGKEFDEREDAEQFADSLAKGFLDFYAETIIAEDGFKVRRRIERYRKIGGNWISVGP